MAINLNTHNSFRYWTVEIPVWNILAALILIPLLILFILLGPGNDDESVALSRNEVIQLNSGERTWVGTMMNTSSNPSPSQYREVAVTIRFLDQDGQTVGETSGQADVLESGEGINLQASLPESVVRMQMYSLQWRTGRANAGRLLGPYRPWEFGYLQYDPAD